jgi:signal peptidase II
MVHASVETTARFHGNSGGLPTHGEYIALALFRRPPCRRARHRVYHAIALVHHRSDVPPEESTLKTWLMRCCAVFFVVAGTAGCDGFTKHLATEKLADGPAHSFLADTIRLTYAENTGAFLSVGGSLPAWARTALFTVATGAFLLALIAAALRSGWQRWRTIALALFVTGGLCNWVDRLGDGRVVDFLNVGVGSIRTGIFNVADVAIMIGVALFLAAELTGSGKKS